MSMIFPRILLISFSVFCLLLVTPAFSQHEHAQHEHAEPAGEPDRLGQVNFPVSCDPAVQPQFNRALALLHSFWYNAAESAFAGVADKDPACAMAHWGVAMSLYHPLWTEPGGAALEAGAAAVERAESAGGKTELERDFISAIAAFYRDYETKDHVTRVLAYEKAMEQLYSRHRGSDEAALFYSLALQGAAQVSPPDATYARQKKAGAIAEMVFAEHPDHPGAAHYVIHAYDYPALADRALDAARRYAKIAPDSPHALHMPSHIFTRLGYWDESIASNIDSRDAARKHSSLGDELHALDYLVYAYLQMGRDDLARRALDEAPGESGGGAVRFAGFYALASMPARYSLERRQWKEAAALEVSDDVFPGEGYSWTEISLHFARGLGAARSGDLAAARAAMQRLSSISDTVQVRYWSSAAEVHRDAVAAWVAHAEGESDKALERMRAAADLEDKIDKHPVSPGYVLPARELLGDLLMELGRPDEAMAEYEAALRSSPRRFNGLYGAAQAAEAAGQPRKAAAFYRQLVDLAGDSESRSAELRHARDFLAQADARKP
jgi:hypothetical protein